MGPVRVLFWGEDRQCSQIIQNSVCVLPPSGTRRDWFLPAAQRAALAKRWVEPAFWAGPGPELSTRSAVSHTLAALLPKLQSAVQSSLGRTTKMRAAEGRDDHSAWAYQSDNTLGPVGSDLPLL